MCGRQISTDQIMLGVIPCEYADERNIAKTTLCLKKVPTFKLSVTLSNLNRFSKILHC